MRFVLEDDGTLIDCEDILPELDKMTRLVVLVKQQEWKTRTLEGKNLRQVLHAMRGNFNLFPVSLSTTQCQPSAKTFFPIF